MEGRVHVSLKAMTTLLVHEMIYLDVIDRSACDLLHRALLFSMRTMGFFLTLFGRGGL